MERQVLADLRALDQSLKNLADDPALEVFPLDSPMLEKTLALTLEKLDLHPWDKKGNSKQPLTGLYDAADVWVYADFVMKTPRRPEGWTGGPACVHRREE
jgi:hypothetical protein